MLRMHLIFSSVSLSWLIRSIIKIIDADKPHYNLTSANYTQDKPDSFLIPQPQHQKKVADPEWVHGVRLNPLPVPHF